MHSFAIDRGGTTGTPLAEGLPASAVARIAAMADACHVPGLCLALLDRGRQAILTMGEDWRGSGRPVSEHSWFQAASAGKHITACLVLQLAARGCIDLAKPIGFYLEDVPSAWATRSIMSLLHHTSGLPEYLAHMPDEPVPALRAGFMRRYAGLDPVAEEGAAWGYSNSNYILLGFLVAQVAGRPCGQAMQEMLDSLGVRGAAVASPDWVRDANARGLGPDARDADSLARDVIGDGDVAFTANGAAAWLRVLVDGGLGPFASDQLFKPGHLATGSAPYGCGLFLDRLSGAQIAYHGGHFDGWTAMLLVHPSTQIGVFALCSLAPGNTRAIRAIGQQVLEAFVPGSTPLSLGPIPDYNPAFTQMARRQLIRESWPVDPDCFAPEMRTAIDCAGPARGMLNLWTGEAPLGFDLVGEEEHKGRTMRRYRLTYPARVEHVSVGMAADGRINWAWPI